MSYDQNYIRIKGRLGRDAEVRYNAQGVAVAKFTVATSEQWKDANGEKKERTEWHAVTAFKWVAEDCAGLLKGERVVVEGSIRTNKWTGKDGVERTDKEILATVVDCIETRKRNKESAPAGAAPAGGTPLPAGGTTEIPKAGGTPLPAAGAAPGAGTDEDDDLLPF